MFSDSRYRRARTRPAVILDTAAARVGYHTANRPRKGALERPSESPGGMGLMSMCF
jgi:hypothetical protein